MSTAAPLVHGLLILNFNILMESKNLNNTNKYTIKMKIIISLYYLHHSLLTLKTLNNKRFKDQVENISPVDHRYLMTYEMR